MKTYCVDTNAILDFCYRYYLPPIFEPLWEQLETAVIAKQVKFIATEHIKEEVLNKIQLFGYDISIFEDLKNRLQVSVLNKDDYDETLLEIKTDLVTTVPAFKGKEVKIDNIEADLSNISTVKIQKGAVITSEQGVKRDITKPNKSTQLKIPDVCHHYNIECCNWVGAFEHLGIKI